MAFEQTRKIGKDIAEIAIMIPIGFGLSGMTHFLPHAYVESNPGKPLGPSESRIFPSRENWEDCNTKEKLGLTAAYIGGFAGLAAQVGIYAYYARENPEVLAIPVLANIAVGLNEINRARKKKRTLSTNQSE